MTPDADGYIVYKGRRVRMISTKNVKKPARKSDESNVAETDAASPRLVKTKLRKKDLDHYRDLLIIERAERLGDLSAMEAEALRSSAGNISTMPIHMADIGSDVYEQDFMLGMAEGERRLIREIDLALQRIQDGTYGVCQMTGKPIPKARLNAKPWAKYTIEAARMVENGQVG